MIRILSFVLCLAGLLIAAGSGPAQAQDRVLVFAAASMGDVITEIGEAWTAQSGMPVTVAAAGSAVLARQIMAGAPAQIYVSANPVWMDILVDESLTKPDNVAAIASNRLVIIAHRDNAEPIDPIDLPSLLTDTRLSIGLTQSVPAGIYGKAALQSLGMWDDVSHRLAETDSVRSALQLVATGQTEFGVVYETDTRLTGDVQIVFTFPPESHPPISYHAGLVEREAAPTNAAASLLDYLKGPEARIILNRHGFLTPGGGF